MPLDEMKKLTTRPLQWLRYMGYCIYGAKGHLQATILGHNKVDPNQTTGLANDYYYFSSHPARFIDIDAIDDKVTDSVGTPRRASFREAVVNRDSICILTRVNAGNCEACHIIPHSKGDEYLASLSVHRGIDPAITEIKDVRNGLLLFIGLHKPFGLGQIGLLLTGAENPYLGVQDVPGCHDPNASHRLIAQHIKPVHQLFDRIADHNTDAAFNNNNNGATRPEPQLLHFFYGCAILKRWGVDAQSPVRNPLRDGDISSWYYNEDHDQDDKDEDGEGNSDENEREEGILPRGRSNAWQSRSMEDVMDFVLSITTRDPLSSITTRDPLLSTTTRAPPEDKTDYVAQWLKGVRK
ncbi:hypothetical protein GGX14DRAFT_589009 [Mycena pura]|uniref:HNH nuclease domain-containing protein n=1 Tax=Mycena pura TaxID=153505 RepID=A0AAD6Y6A1_9AGAR|nr:hypothetical protein GGX14DRAFT_589009 [Mycena pura]